MTHAEGFAGSELASGEHVRWRFSLSVKAAPRTLMAGALLAIQSAGMLSAGVLHYQDKSGTLVSQVTEVEIRVAAESGGATQARVRLSDKSWRGLRNLPERAKAVAFSETREIASGSETDAAAVLERQPLLGYDASNRILALITPGRHAHSALLFGAESPNGLDFELSAAVDPAAAKSLLRAVLKLLPTQAQKQKQGLIDARHGPSEAYIDVLMNPPKPPAEIAEKMAGSEFIAGALKSISGDKVTVSALEGEVTRKIRRKAEAGKPASEVLLSRSPSRDLPIESWRLDRLREVEPGRFVTLEADKRNGEIIRLNLFQEADP